MTEIQAIDRLEDENVVLGHSRISINDPCLPKQVSAFIGTFHLESFGSFDVYSSGYVHWAENDISSAFTCATNYLYCRFS